MSASAYQDVIIAGFGGQGVMLIGNLLAQAGMEYGREVSFLPVYGAEMRGGTANCTVVIDSEAVGSPLVRSPLSTIVLNEPSLARFQPRLDESGVWARGFWIPGGAPSTFPPTTWPCGSDP